MIPGSGFRPHIVYMNEAERQLFRKMREDGTLSYFRTSACAFCKVEILKGKTYCSKRCMLRRKKLRDAIMKALDVKRKG